MSKRGQYIVVEGIDGSGKTTQFNHLLVHLKGAVGVREPGGTPMGEHIRTILKDKEIPRSGPTNSFLFAAARADLVSTVIRPSVLVGTHVVSDRNWLSTYAYQSAEGVDVQDIVSVNKLATSEFSEPDLLLLIDVDPIICRQRTQTRGGADTDYFDSKGNDYFERVRAAYLDGIKNQPNGIVVDGTGTPEEVWSRVVKILNERGIS